MYYDKLHGRRYKRGDKQIYMHEYMKTIEYVHAYMIGLVYT